MVHHECPDVERGYIPEYWKERVAAIHYLTWTRVTERIPQKYEVYWDQLHDDVLANDLDLIAVKGSQQSQDSWALPGYNPPLYGISYTHAIIYLLPWQGVCVRHPSHYDAMHSSMGFTETPPENPVDWNDLVSGKD